MVLGTWWIRSNCRPLWGITVKGASLAAVATQSRSPLTARRACRVQRRCNQEKRDRQSHPMSRHRAANAVPGETRGAAARPRGRRASSKEATNTETLLPAPSMLLCVSQLPDLCRLPLPLPSPPLAPQ